MLLSFIISGMPLAVSKLIAEETALNNNSNVRKIMTVSTVLLGSLGIFGTVVLWFFADFFAIAMKEPKAVFCLKVIAPFCVLCCSRHGIQKLLSRQSKYDSHCRIASYRSIHKAPCRICPRSFLFQARGAIYRRGGNYGRNRR